MIEKLKKSFILSNIFSATGTLSILSIIFLQNIQNEKSYNIISVIIGFSFWVSLLAEFVMIFSTGKCRKSLQKEKTKNKAGIISFMKTPAGKIIDIVFFIFILVLVVLIIMKINNYIIVIPVFSAVYLLFHLHCFYNGKNYVFLKEIVK